MAYIIYYLIRFQEISRKEAYIMLMNHPYKNFMTYEDAKQPPIEMDEGFLIVEVRMPDGAPIPNATITIDSEDGGPIRNKILKTDPEGRTEMIALPAPAKKYSLTATSVVVPYSQYTVRVQYPGYYTNVYQNAQIFARTTTTQTSRMTLLPPGVKDSSELEKIYKIPPPMA
jgi:hypothetical protein